LTFDTKSLSNIYFDGSFGALEYNAWACLSRSIIADHHANLPATRYLAVLKGFLFMAFR